MEEPLDAPRDDPQSFNGSGWRGFTDLPCLRRLRRDRRHFARQLHPPGHAQAAQALLVPMAELPTTGIDPNGIAVTLSPLGALLVLVTTVTLAVFKPWGQTRFQRH